MEVGMRRSVSTTGHFSRSDPTLHVVSKLLTLHKSIPSPVHILNRAAQIVHLAVADGERQEYPPGRGVLLLNHRKSLQEPSHPH
jgi:hypothetical protein